VPPETAPAPRERTLYVVVAFAFLATVLAATTGYFVGHREDPDTNLKSHPTPTLLVATKDLSRLQTSELHVEKVVDLTDKQEALFGMVQGTDNVLLVAVGEVAIGVDLGKLADGDVTLDPKSKAAHFRLPAPEIFSSRLDENATYVYSRQTSMFAKRNEQLETRARQEAQNTIRKQADTEESKSRAKGQAEKILRQLATGLGASSVTFDWK
jgi:hypothetical protein